MALPHGKPGIDDLAATVAVLGAGVMGTGIATLAAGSGHDVVLIDVDPAALTRAAAQVPQQLRLARLTGRLPADRTDGTVTTTADLAAVAGASTVVEAVTEDPGLKKALLADVSTAVAAGTTLMSNTSAIPIDELAGVLVRPAELLGVHFMNPPYLITSVEVIRGPRTGADVLAAGLAVLADWGREAIVVGDGPGFVVNRILQRMINEAARIVEEGIADPASVDAVFTGCLGHRTGPLGTADLIGLDNVADSLRVLLDRTGDEGYRPCRLLEEKVQAGALGRKTGHGFFEYGGLR